MKQLRLLLLPFSLIYGAVLCVRHFLYDKGFLKVSVFDKPVLVVGNLVVGGAGKSPMTEYLIRLLSPHLKVATLSRGYGRKTKGFLEVQTDSLAEMVGDEPLQFKRKFPYITVADCESRVLGLEQLMPKHDVCILDDGFQHRALKAGLTILLFDFNSLAKSKFLLPAGDYRDLYARRNRADIIVITKCPQMLDNLHRERARQQLDLKHAIPVFFSSIAYGTLTHLLNGSPMLITKQTSFILFTGIANPRPFIDQMKVAGEVVQTFIYADHHLFSLADVNKIRKYWEQKGRISTIVTTEKDAMRLRHPAINPLLADLPIYYMPIEMVFQETTQGQKFDDLVRNKILN